MILAEAIFRDGFCIQLVHTYLSNELNIVCIGILGMPWGIWCLVFFMALFLVRLADSKKETGFCDTGCSSTRSFLLLYPRLHLSMNCSFCGRLQYFVHQWRSTLFRCLVWYIIELCLFCIFFSSWFSVMMKTDDESDVIHSIKPCGQSRHLSERA